MTKTEHLILNLIDNNEEKFFSPEFIGLYDEQKNSRYEITKACYSLVNKGILKRRNCYSLAFERV